MKNPPESAKTARKQVAAVFAWAHDNGLLGPVNVDVGGGPFETASDWCAARGVKNYVFDPYNRPENHNAEVLEKLAGSADSVTLTNVLNVIPSEEERLDVLLRCKHFARTGGVLLVQVYKKPGLSKPTRTRDGWQLGKPASFYLAEVQSVFPDAVLAGGFIVAHAQADALPRAQNAGLDPQVAQAVFAAAPGRKARLTGPEAEPVLAAYLAARGYVRDPRSAKSFISPDASEKWVLEERVLQRWSGGRGAWHKLASSSKTSAAEKILAAARAVVSGDAAPVVAHAERVKKTRSAAVARRSTAARDAARGRLSLAAFSANLTPADRRALLERGGVPRDDLPVPSDALLDDLSDAQIDRVLTVDTPPLFERWGGAGWPTSFTWAEGPYDVTVTRASGTRLDIEIGSTAAAGGVGLRIDPSSFAVRGVSRHRGAPGGLTGSIVVTERGPVAALSYFGVTGEKKKGVGSELVRLFCRLAAGYGLEGFVAVAVGADGRAFFERLASRGVAVQPIPGTANLLVSCAEVLEARGQTRMWNPDVSASALAEAEALDEVARTLPSDDPSRRELTRQAVSLRTHGVKALAATEEETEEQWAQRLVAEAMRFPLKGVTRWYPIILAIMNRLGAKRESFKGVPYMGLESTSEGNIVTALRAEFAVTRDFDDTLREAGRLASVIGRYITDGSIMSFFRVLSPLTGPTIVASAMSLAGISQLRYRALKVVDAMRESIDLAILNTDHHASIATRPISDAEDGDRFYQAIIDGREAPLTPDDTLLFLAGYGIDVRSKLVLADARATGSSVMDFAVVHGNVAVTTIRFNVNRQVPAAHGVVDYPVVATVAIPVLRDLTNVDELEIPLGGLFDIHVGRPTDHVSPGGQYGNLVPMAELALLGEQPTMRHYGDTEKERHRNLVRSIQEDYDAGRDSLAEDVAEYAHGFVASLLSKDFPGATFVEDPAWFHEWLAASLAVPYDEFIVGVNADEYSRRLAKLKSKWAEYEAAYGMSYPAMFMERELAALKATLAEKGVKSWKYSRRMNRPRRRRGRR